MKLNTKLNTKNVAGVIQIILGVLFLLNAPTDIQLGFGIVLVTTGIANMSNR